MGKIRKPFQGVFNIIRFNWHFYVLSVVVVSLLLTFAWFVDNPADPYVYVAALLIIDVNLVSLVTSCLIYDFSGLYDFKWIKANGDEEMVVNINAGFDETSTLLAERFKHSKLLVLDFYDPAKHTEVSIKRARKAYPPYHGTVQTTTRRLPAVNNTADKVFVIFAAHEIRDEQERIDFFLELNRILKPGGIVYVVEHLRDAVNFLTYNIGFLHFHSKFSWQQTFTQSNFRVRQELKLTPFISAFILVKNGDTH
ncbi:class I SAM-dependent methyltransferase [uncultured Chitinophaga sp.]|uniref:class I SAM-dependent methyltransferase n=1 Tax=uncultured Chitinophaga sp. TaxID=339340 RepID=UPI0025DB2FDC|nr:class I SAM-dependent methyltransferase [uncultured Chitinophaga sp.]